MPESEAEFEREQEDAAAAEAAAIGGRVPPALDEDGEELDEADRPLAEAGEGESEGFELAESALEEHASHGDQHGTSRIGQDAAGFDEDRRAADGGEADAERPEDL